MKSAWIIKNSGGRTPSANATALTRTSETNSRSSAISIISENDENVKEKAEKVVGEKGRAYVNGNSAEEYSKLTRKYDSATTDAKMRAANELDNILDAGTNFRNESDGADGHFHADVVGGFDKFDVIFKVGGDYYSGIINIKNNKLGKLFYDVTQIKNITQDLPDSNGDNPTFRFLNNVSDVIIPENDENVKEKTEKSTAEKVTAARTAGMTWAYGKSGREVYSSAEAGGVLAAVYDKVMTRVYSDAYGGKSDTEIYKAARAIAGDKISDGDIGDMIDAAISDRAEKKYRKVVRREGKVNFAGANISADEKRAISALARYAQVDIDFADLGDANGKYENGRITIDIHADKPLAVVLGHEAYHRFFEAAPEAARTVEKLAYAAATEKDADILRKTLEKYMDAGKPINIGDAIEEIAADYMGDIVSKPERVEALIKLANTKKKKSALARFVAWVRERWNNFKSRRNGELSGAEEKTDEAVDAIVDMMRRASVELEVAAMAREETTGETKYSLRKEFSEEFDKWIKEKSADKRAVDGGWFNIGTTSKTLKEIGARDGNIYWRKQKIQAIMEDHPEMTPSIVKNVPDIIENPIVVMKSQTVDSSIVMLGNITSEKGPVMAALELTPIPTGGVEAEFSLITSSYSKGENGTKNLLKNSEILYIAEKNRVDTLLMSLGVQFPSGQQVYDSVTGSISYKDGNVNISGKKIFANEEKNDLSTEKFSIKDKTLSKSEITGMIGENVHDGEDKYSLKEITTDDVRSIREIAAAHGGKRVSINDFTSEDIEKAEPWARKFYSELGTKSPFFRAWFGDWRAHDAGKVDFVDKSGGERGTVNNNDTGWDIIISRQVTKETEHHSGSSEKNAVKYLPYITDITKKAVLLNTTISSRENPNSALFHDLYAYTDVFGYPALLKLKVEELISDRGVDQEVFKRDYILQNIKEESISERNRLSTPNHSETNSSINSISDLFALVKTYDKEFHPKEVNSALLNEDGTPKVVMLRETMMERLIWIMNSKIQTVALRLKLFLKKM